VIAACIEVHRQLEPGLLESTYELCLAHEFTGLPVALFVNFNVITLKHGLRGLTRESTSFLSSCLPV